MLAYSVRSLVAGLVMLCVGWVFNQFERFCLPSIRAEYSPPIFRPWPGWTVAYMVAHPLLFGLLFAAGYAFARPGFAAWWRLPWPRLAFGIFVFLIGSLPIMAIVFASFAVSPLLVAVS